MSPFRIRTSQDLGGLGQGPFPPSDRSFHELSFHRIRESDEFRYVADPEVLLSILLSPNEMPKELDPRQRLGVLMADCIELLISALQLTRKAEKLGQEEPSPRVGRSLPDVFGHDLDRFR
jgi:hypothetical protein